MKKSLVSFGLIATMSLGLMAPLNINPSLEMVQAASEVNFDQGSLSDEEYVKSIIDQFMALDAIQAEFTDYNDDTFTSTSLIDIKNKAMYMKTNSPDYQSETYTYNDGTVAETATATLDMLNAIYMDKAAEIDEIAKEVDGKYLTREYPEAKNQVDAMLEQYTDVLEQFETFENKDGVVIASTATQPISEVKNSDMLAQVYGPDTTVQTVIKVDPKAKTLTYETIIDINEDAVEETTSEDSLGISFSDFIQDRHTAMVLTPSSDSVPGLDTLETMTQDEFNTLLTDKGLEAFY